MALLSVKHLNVRFKTPDGIINAVNDVSFDLAAGETLGIVGESGSGKSQTVLALMGLSATNSIVTGSAKLNDEELIGIPVKKLNRIRGNAMTMIFQDPMTSLNPYLSIETQLCETMMVHHRCSYKEALQRAIHMLDVVHIPEAKNRIKLYPHEFSGGMRQRVVIAMALMCNPKLLIADEPTTALDVTVQAQILALLKELQRDFHMATILITHDIGVVAGACDRVMVMYGGAIVENATTDALFTHRLHPYTQGLMLAAPRIDMNHEQLSAIPGEPPDLVHLPSGCSFMPRCHLAQMHCQSEKPPLLSTQYDQEHTVACFYAGRQKEVTNHESSIANR